MKRHQELLFIMRMNWLQIIDKVLEITIDVLMTKPTCIKQIRSFVINDGHKLRILFILPPGWLKSNCIKLLEIYDNWSNKNHVWEILIPLKEQHE